MRAIMSSNSLTLLQRTRVAKYSSALAKRNDGGGGDVRSRDDGTSIEAAYGGGAKHARLYRTCRAGRKQLALCQRW